MSHQPLSQHTSKFKAYVFLWIAVLCFSNNAIGESFVQQGNYELHYHAFHSIDVDPKALRLHQLQRAPNVGMLNVSLLETLPDGTRSPKKANIVIKSNNLVGQHKALEAQPVIETNAIYYISQFRFANDETFRFHITAIPEDDPETQIEVSFNQRFFVNK